MVQTRLGTGSTPRRIDVAGESQFPEGNALPTAVAPREERPKDEASARTDAVPTRDDAIDGLLGERGTGRPFGGKAHATGSDSGPARTSVDKSTTPDSPPPSKAPAGSLYAKADRPLVIGAPPLDEPAYLLWNRALVHHCLLDDQSHEDAFLTITPTILAAALAAAQPGRLPSEEAEARFVQAVTDLYHSRVLREPQGLGVLRRCSVNGLPDCVAFLAASVLAAYRMQTDEEATASAYYFRLAELLKCDLVGGHPRGFDPEEFEALWRFLERWISEKGRRLAMPGPDAGFRRFVALTLTHVPLRRVDIERLPDFFTWAGYQPGARMPRQRLDQDLSSWSLGRSVFTNAGTAALADERRRAVMAQVAHELESWDGSQTDSFGRRSARVEILIDPVMRRPELFYLARRPPAFPSLFSDGVHSLEASHDGWYDPVPIPPEDGSLLAEGFAWELEAGVLRLVLHRPAARAIALPESPDYTGYMSHSNLRLGVRGAVLCLEAYANQVAGHLSEVSQQRCASLNHPNVPDGWRLFAGFRPQRRLDAPGGLEALAVESSVDLVPEGGLRLGSRWAWVAGAAPRLVVAGLTAGDQVTIDGDPVMVADDGELAAEGRLGRPGTHVVEVGGTRRWIEIVEPTVRNASLPLDRQGTAVALPPGSWTLVGATPGEVTNPVCRSRGGAVALCSFSAVWAIDVGAGPGATVLCLGSNPSLPARVERFPSRGRAARSALSWASTIYNAAIRRPRMTLLHTDEVGAEVKETWAVYSRWAREIKRRFRSVRR
ncbi:MAG: hypothetical protein HY700_17205 [Gemmatimonadetes bacterium]|nr:hypothetical protein [Gemmatimonadota bacterium]